jgi:hypothetical protein
LGKEEEVTKEVQIAKETLQKLMEHGRAQQNRNEWLGTSHR